MQQQERERRIELLRGSRRWSRGEARYLLEIWIASREPLSTFARRIKVGAERLRWWHKRLDMNSTAIQSELAPATPKFVPVVLKAEPVKPLHQSAAAVLLVDCARVELRELDSVSAAWVAMVFDALRDRR